MTEIKVTHNFFTYTLGLFKEETLPLVFTADDYQNIAERSSSYSKSFEVPGTKSNNILFSYMFDVKTDSTFDPHKKVECVVEVDTVEVFKGWLQLNTIIVKDKRNVSYEVTIFSDIVNIKDTLSELKFRDMDFSELEHYYSITQIQRSWDGTLASHYNNAATSGFRDGDTVKYPFVRWTNEIYYRSDAASPVPHISLPTLGAGLTDFTPVYRPWIQVDYIFRRILKDSGYTVNSSFMGTAAWTKLYVDFSPAADAIGTARFTDTEPVHISLGATWTKIEWTGSHPFGTGVTDTLDPADYYDTGTDEITLPAATDGTQVIGKCNLYVRQVSVVTSSISTRVAHYDTSAGTTTYYNMHVNATLPNNLATGLWTNIGQAQTVSIPCDTGDRLWMEASVSSGTATILNSSASGTNNPQGIASYMNWDIQRNFMNFGNVLSGDRGEIVQWDFIKSFISIFNLVVFEDADNPTQINIEPYRDWVDSGVTHYWEDKLNEEEITLVPIEGLDRDIRFMFREDSGDFITKAHANPNHWKYSHLFQSGDEIYEEADGEMKVDMFSSTYCGFIGGDFWCPHIMNDNGDRYWGHNMRLLYDCGTTTTSTGYGILGLAQYYEILVFSSANQHYPVSGSSLSLNFAVVDYEGPGGGVIRSLFNEYWSGYINELYHKDTRIAKVSMKIEANEIQKFNFEDIIHIRGVNYRVKSIDYDGAGHAEVELITIKDL